LTYELDIDIPKVHLHTKMNFLGQGFEKYYRQWYYRVLQTDRFESCDLKHQAYSAAVCLFCDQ